MKNRLASLLDVSGPTKLGEVVIPVNLNRAEGELIPSSILSLPFLGVFPAVIKVHWT